MWELLVGALSLAPLLVGLEVLVLELCELVLVLDTALDWVGTKVLIGEEDGEGGVYVEGQVPIDGSYTAIGVGAGPVPLYPGAYFQRLRIRITEERRTESEDDDRPDRHHHMVPPLTQSGECIYVNPDHGIIGRVQYPAIAESRL